MGEHAVCRALDAIYGRYEGLQGLGRLLGQRVEPIIRSYYEILVEPGDVVIDLGACIGFHTIPLARAVGPNGRVIAFEPIPQCAEQIIRRLENDGLSDRVSLHANAVTLDHGEATFFFVDGAVGHSGLRPKRRWPAGSQVLEIRVQTAPLDAFLPEDGRVTFVKADLEGGEYHALVSGRRLLEAHRPILVFESALTSDSNRFGFRIAEFMEFFRSLEYALVDILGCPFRESHASRLYPHYLVGYPLEDAQRANQALSLAMLENLFHRDWLTSESGHARRGEADAVGGGEEAAG